MNERKGIVNLLTLCSRLFSPSRLKAPPVAHRNLIIITTVAVTNGNREAGPAIIITNI